MLVQVALMRVVDSAVAAMEAHQGVAGAAQNGLDLLASLAFAAENRVRGNCV